MKSIKLFALFALALIMSSCGGNQQVAMTAADVDATFSSGVVLIKNVYYYEIKFSNFEPIYFSEINDEGDLVGATFDAAEIQQMISWGTGFFISDDGWIATNSHVANPAVDTKQVRNNISSMFRTLADQWQSEVSELSDAIALLQSAILDSNNYSDINDYKAKLQELSEERDKTQKAINMVHDVQGSDYEVYIHNEISVAYSDTHVTNYDDFIPCVNLLDDQEHDVAIIQLKSKKTPEDRVYFEIPYYDGAEEPETPVGTKLFLIGYNLGPSLAITEGGLKPQVTEGAITQNTDGVKIMYSIPTLHGSSGSPVVDEFGTLVAVNFAGLDVTQNFNYGIKVKHLANLVASYTSK